MSLQTPKKSVSNLLDIVHESSSKTTKLASKIFHSSLEPILDFIQNYLFQPKAIFAAAIFGILGQLFFYTCSVLSGFKLSGSEPLLCFLTGWIIISSLRLLKHIALGGSDKL